MLLLALIVSVACYAGLFWIVCWAFNIAFSWRIFLGVYICLVMLSGFVRKAGGDK